MKVTERCGRKIYTGTFHLYSINSYYITNSGAFKNNFGGTLSDFFTHILIRVRRGINQDRVGYTAKTNQKTLSGLKQQTLFLWVGKVVEHQPDTSFRDDKRIWHTVFWYLIPLPESDAQHFHLCFIGQSRPQNNI